MSSVQSIDRMFMILEIIADNKDGIGISEISEQTALHKSTVHRLAMSLLENGYIEQLDNTKYKITYKLYKIGAAAIGNTNVSTASRKSIQNLAGRVNEVVHLVVRNENNIVYIDKENPIRNSSIMGSSIGSTAPIYCTSAGKAMLFEADDSEINNMWNISIINKKTDKTITDYKKFLQEIKFSKERGYAIDDEENEIGIRCIGVPIYNHKNEICAAISISAPSSRMTETNIEQYCKSLKEAAFEISKKLGYTL